MRAHLERLPCWINASFAGCLIQACCRIPWIPMRISGFVVSIWRTRSRPSSEMCSGREKVPA